MNTFATSAYLSVSSLSSACFSVTAFQFSGKYNFLYVAADEKQNYRGWTLTNRRCIHVAFQHWSLLFSEHALRFLSYNYFFPQLIGRHPLNSYHRHRTLICKERAKLVAANPFRNFRCFLFGFFFNSSFKTNVCIFHGPTAGFLLRLVKGCSSFAERCEGYWRLGSVTCLCFGSERRWIHPHHVAASADEGSIPDNVLCEQSAGHGWYKKTWHNELDPEVYQLAAVLSK